MGILGGAVAALAGRREPHVPEPVPPGVRVVRGRWIPELGGRLAGTGRAAAAVTLGSTIVVHPDAALTARLLRHELAHTRQWARRPVLFPILYMVRHALYGYRDNPYEVAARAAEEREHPAARGNAGSSGQPGGKHGQP